VCKGSWECEGQICCFCFARFTCSGTFATKDFKNLQLIYTVRFTITFIVSRHCRYSADSPQGGVEVPCILVFCGKKKYLLKINKLKHVEKRLQL